MTMCDAYEVGGIMYGRFLPDFDRQDKREKFAEDQPQSRMIWIIILISDLHPELFQLVVGKTAKTPKSKMIRKGNFQR